MMCAAYVILPMSDWPPADEIADSLERYQFKNATMQESWLAFRDVTGELRGLYETPLTCQFREGPLTLTEKHTGGIEIRGMGATYLLDRAKIQDEMISRGVRNWRLRFADAMTFDAFYEHFCLKWERHPVTGALGEWVNPLGKWDWWELGGRFDGLISGKESVDTPDPLSCAASQEQLHLPEFGEDRNIAPVSTLLQDAQKGHDYVYSAVLVLPPGAIEDKLRWLESGWSGTSFQPKEIVAWLGLAAEVCWRDIVPAVYRRFENHWAAGITFHR
jgi:hypothetical protein